MAVESYDLFGEHQSPAFNLGDVVLCAMRGPVRIAGVTSARIPWPTGKRIEGRIGTTPAIILCDGLIDAVKNESNRTVCYWWVSPVKRRLAGARRWGSGG